MQETSQVLEIAKNFIYFLHELYLFSHHFSIVPIPSQEAAFKINFKMISSLSVAIFWFKSIYHINFRA